MKLIEWINGVTKLNKKTMDNFQNNVNDAISENQSIIIGNTNDAYDPTLTYSVGAIVIYENKLYKCIIDITEPEAWDSTKWEESNLKSLVKENTDAIKTNKENIDKKQNQLTPGENIKIDESGIISATGGGSQFLTQTITGTITAEQYNSKRGKIGTLVIPDGYTFLGLLIKNATGSNTDNSASIYLNGTTVYGEVGAVHSGYTGTITATALYMKNSEETE